MRACIASVASWVKRNWRQDDRGAAQQGQCRNASVKAGQIRDASDELRDLQAAGLFDRRFVFLRRQVINHPRHLPGGVESGQPAHGGGHLIALVGIGH